MDPPISELVVETPVQVRRANPADYPECLAVDASMSTNLVWQVQEQATADRFAVECLPSRLPRAVTVGIKHEDSDPLQRLASSDLLLVAEEEGKILGYLKAARRQGVGWLDEVAVHSDSRRRGVATALVQGFRIWAKEQGLGALLTEVPARHEPAIRLLQKCGFVFCGFDDHLYDGRDIVIKLALKV